MNPLDLPSVVLDDHLFPLLDWDDLLCIRRVCKAGKAAVASYLAGKPNLVPEVTIGREDKTLSEFLKLDLDIPIRKLELLNKGPLFYYDPALQIDEFLARYGHGITHLRLLVLGTLMVPKELDFLKRLDHLEVLIVKNWLSPQGFEIGRLQPEPELIPIEQYYSVFLRLKRLELRNESPSLALATFQSIFTAAIGTITRIPESKTLESFCVPFIGSPRNVSIVCELDPMPINLEPDRLLEFYFVAQVLQLDCSPPSLKTISVGEFIYNTEMSVNVFNLEMRASPLFFNLAEMCCRKGVTLEGVNANLFRLARLIEITQNVAELGSCIKSLVNIHPTVVNVIALENMERLTVYTSKSCPLYMDGAGPRDAVVATRPAWPLLKELFLVVDSDGSAKSYEEIRLNDEGVTAREYPSVPVQLIAEFLFRDVVAINLKTLGIRFDNEFGKSMHHESCIDLIVQSCPNLVNLEIKGWPGKSEPLAQLWQGLNNLKKVTFMDCKDLGDVAFIGENLRKPSFLCLRNLETLRLLGLEKMPNITDALFELVLRHMPLKTLEISSGAPVKSVTVSGIRQLKNGPFAGSVSKFPFKDWSVDKCSQEEWTNLSKEFRSYYRL